MNTSEKSKYVDSLIDSIKLDRSNIGYILESGRINGSLWADLRTILYKAIQYGIEAKEHPTVKVEGSRTAMQVLIEKIKQRMELYPDDPVPSERGAYDAYLNCLNLATELLELEKK